MKDLRSSIGTHFKEGSIQPSRRGDSSIAFGTISGEGTTGIFLQRGSDRSFWCSWGAHLFPKSKNNSRQIFQLAIGRFWWWQGFHSKLLTQYLPQFKYKSWALYPKLYPGDVLWGCLGFKVHTMVDAGQMVPQNFVQINWQMNWLLQKNFSQFSRWGQNIEDNSTTAPKT